MKRSFCLLYTLFGMFCLVSLASQENRKSALEELYKAAEQRDPVLQSIDAQWRILGWEEASESYKHGFKYELGTGDEGLRFSPLGDSELSAQGAAKTRLLFPEETGLSISAALPFAYRFDGQAFQADFSLGFQQSLTTLFHPDGEDRLTRIERKQKRSELLEKEQRRVLELRRELLMLFRGLYEHRKTVLSTETELFEKEQLLEYQLKSQTILRNGSGHLSSLMEIRELKQAIEQSRGALESSLRRIRQKTGLHVRELPLASDAALPEVQEELRLFSSPIVAVQRNLARLEAEYADLRDGKRTEWELAGDAQRSLEAQGAGGFSLSLSGEAEDMKFSLFGGYSEKEHWFAGTAFTYQPRDRTKELLSQSILEQRIALTREELASSMNERKEREAELKEALAELSARRAGLEDNQNFIQEYMKETEEKYQRGLIPEMEYRKAADRIHLVEYDRMLLNIDIHLLDLEMQKELVYEGDPR